MVRQGPTGAGQAIPPPEELIAPDMDLGLGPDALAPALLGAPDLSLDPAQQSQVIAPETLDVLARIFSLGDQMQTPALQPAPTYAPPPPPPITSAPPPPPRPRAKAPAPRYHRDYSVRPPLFPATTTCLTLGAAPPAPQPTLAKSPAPPRRGPAAAALSEGRPVPARPL